MSLTDCAAVQATHIHVPCRWRSRQGHEPRHPLQTGRQSRPQQHYPYRCHNPTCPFANGTGVKITRQHVHSGWRRSPGHAPARPLQLVPPWRPWQDIPGHTLTRPCQMASQSKPHAVTSLITGAAVQATYRHVLYKLRRSFGHNLAHPLQMVPQSKTHTHTPLGDGIAVQATHGQIHCGRRRNPVNRQNRPLQMALQSKANTDTPLADGALFRPHADTFIAAGAAVQATNLHVPCN
jgi:hypothetical protein